ncbi:hypothetical protein EHI87_08280 [Cronobacter malonaticus]|nr:hypothetical protein [Cronobacter malonaticus]
MCNNPLTQSLTRDCFITVFQAKKAAHPTGRRNALFWCAIVVHRCGKSAQIVQMDFCLAFQNSGL